MQSVHLFATFENTAKIDQNTIRTRIICHNPIGLIDPKRICNLTMSASREVSLIVSQPTSTFLALVKDAAHDTQDKTNFATAQLAQLNYTTSCQKVYNGFTKGYLNMVNKVYHLYTKLIIFHRFYQIPLSL